MNIKPYNLKKLTREELIQLKNEVDEILDKPVLRTVADIISELDEETTVHSAHVFPHDEKSIKRNRLEFCSDFLNKKEALSAIAYYKLCLIINDANSRSEGSKQQYFNVFNGKIENYSYHSESRTNPLPLTTEEIAEQMMKSDYHLKLLKQYFMIN